MADLSSDIDCSVVESVVQLAASKIALLLGLHEFGDVAGTVLEYIYQHREHLLERDAKALGLTLVFKDDELDALLDKTGEALLPQFQKIMAWTRDRQQPVTQGAAATLLESVNGLVSQAQSKRKLKAEEAREVKRQLNERIRLSYGCRNEDLALKTYERQTGSSVRLTNQQYYILRFPRLDDTPNVSTDFELIEKEIDCVTVNKGDRQLGVPSSEEISVGDDGSENGAETCERAPYFTICGMIDGIADTLQIVSDEEWEMIPVLVEVKNRLRGFRVPPPLYEYIQMAIYFKMTGVTQGDLVQCLHADRAQIHITRASLTEYPLQCKTPTKPGRGDSLWPSVILPRLYILVKAIEKFRRDDSLRFAFLNGDESERIAILRQECDFL